MPSYHRSSSSTSSSTIPMINHKKMPSIETIPEKVNRYTELLLVSDNKYEIENAFLRLFQIDTSIRVYEKCRLEYILRKRFDGNINYLYQVNRLFKRLLNFVEKSKRSRRKREKRRNTIQSFHAFVLRLKWKDIHFQNLHRIHLFVN